MASCGRGGGLRRAYGSAGSDRGNGSLYGKLGGAIGILYFFCIEGIIFILVYEYRRERRIASHF
jgi:hypothetical protein